MSITRILTRKINDGEEVETEEIREWINKQPESQKLEDDKETIHVRFTMESIIGWYQGKIRRVGGFVRALLQNSFIDASCRADSTNKKVLPLYAKFLHKILPGDWSDKAEAQF